MKKLFISLTFASILFSCDVQPECASEDVKSLALDIATDLTVIDLAYSTYIKENQYNSYLEFYAEQHGINALVEQIKTEIRSELSARNDSSSYNSHIDNAIELLNGLDPVITNVRTASKQPELQKCTCEAQVGLNNENSLDVVYKVQFNEDGDTYIELELL
jgi:hypothetical protein